MVIFVGEEKMKFVKYEILKKYPTFFTNYEEKRQDCNKRIDQCLFICRRMY